MEEGLGYECEVGVSSCQQTLFSGGEGAACPSPDSPGSTPVPPCRVPGGGRTCVSLQSACTFSPRLKRNESSSSVQNYFHLDSLQKKLKDLEEENVVLRSEVNCAS